MWGWSRRPRLEIRSPDERSEIRDPACRPLRGLMRATNKLIQLRLDVADAVGEQPVGDIALRALGEDFLRGGDGRFGGGGAHVGHRLSLRLGDLGFRHLRAARDEFA
jgi:hypothetical protein